MHVENVDGREPAGLLVYHLSISRPQVERRCRLKLGALSSYIEKDKNLIFDISYLVIGIVSAFGS